MSERENMNRKRSRRKSSGFTLIELMFAAGVLAMGLSLLFGSLVSIELSGQVAEGKTKATAYMSSVLEQVRATPRDNLLSDFVPLAPPEDKGYAMAVTLEAVNNTGATVTLPLPANAGGTSTTPSASGTGASLLPTPLPIRATVVYSTPRGHLFSITSMTYAGSS